MVGGQLAYGLRSQNWAYLWGGKSTSLPLISQFLLLDCHYHSNHSGIWLPISSLLNLPLPCSPRTASVVSDMGQKFLRSRHFRDIVLPMAHSSTSLHNKKLVELKCMMRRGQISQCTSNIPPPAAHFGSSSAMVTCHKLYRKRSSGPPNLSDRPFYVQTHLTHTLIDLYTTGQCFISIDDCILQSLPPYKLTPPK